MNLALHVEYKRDGKPGESGPGETLRLAHALDVADLLTYELTLVTASCHDSIAALFPGIAIHRLPGGAAEGQPVGNVDEHDLAQRLEGLFGAGLPGVERVYQAFIGNEARTPWTPDNELALSTGALSGVSGSTRRNDSTGEGGSG